MEILNSEQVRQADQLTIIKKSIDSTELMESAAIACLNEITQEFNNTYKFHVFCGPGNNGGDGLAIARLLNEKSYEVAVTLLNVSGKLSHDNHQNLQKAISGNLKIDQINRAPDRLEFDDKTIIVDALFGIGLNQPATGEFAKLIEMINHSGRYIISIDMPSGLFSDQPSIQGVNNIVKASVTYTFQYPKQALLMPENADYFGGIKVLDIGLIHEATVGMNIMNYLLDEYLVASMLLTRPAFSHKGTFGHSLIIAGGEGKMGACILSAGAFLKSGAGLLTVLVPDNHSDVIYSSLPEAMVHNRSDLKNTDLNKYNVIGIGPGTGTDIESNHILNHLLNNWTNRLVIDADALNILSENKSWLNRIPEGSVLTPHPGEFRKLFGDWKNDFEKIKKQREFSIKMKCVIVLKGKNTSIACPDGRIYFNPTGNSGMAKGGSGDVLTGLITGLISSGYNSVAAACLGVYLHGYAGDLAARHKTEQGMTAGDIISCLPEAWKKVTNG
jgi:hydroxyethylthiazole kinase-like uncharacterized protein yjeF